MLVYQRVQSSTRNLSQIYGNIPYIKHMGEVLRAVWSFAADHWTKLHRARHLWTSLGFPEFEPNALHVLTWSVYWIIDVHPWKLTWQWNITIFNRKYIFKFKGSIFHCCVSLAECTWIASFQIRSKRQCTNPDFILKTSHFVNRKPLDVWCRMKYANLLHSLKIGHPKRKFIFQPSIFRCEHKFHPWKSSTLHHFSPLRTNDWNLIIPSLERNNIFHPSPFLGFHVTFRGVIFTLPP